MKFGDLVMLKWEGENQEDLIGLVLEDSYRDRESHGVKHEYKDIWWMEKDRVSPVRTKYLQVISENSSLD